MDGGCKGNQIGKTSITHQPTDSLEHFRALRLGNRPEPTLPAMNMLSVNLQWYMNVREELSLQMIDLLRKLADLSFMDGYTGQHEIIDFIKAAWIARLIEVKQIQFYPL
jgi:hypothetical protein